MSQCACNVAALFAGMLLIMSPVTSSGSEQQRLAQDTVTPTGGDDAAVNQTDLTLEVKTNSGKAVSGAAVFVRSRPPGRFTPRQDITNSRGKVPFPGVPRGRIKIAVSAIGMKSFAREFDVGPNEEKEQTISIELVPEVTANPEDDVPHDTSNSHARG